MSTGGGAATGRIGALQAQGQFSGVEGAGSPLPLAAGVIL
jgi:hypothetical protein